MRRLIVSLLTSLLALPALAQDDVIEVEEPEIRRYTVEVIIFRYAEDVNTGSEVFLPDEPEEPLPEEDLLILDEPVPDEEEQEPLPDTELVLLTEDDYQLVDMLERLEDLDAYEPLMHFGWTQATWPDEQTEPVPLIRFANPPDGLDGSLELYLGRYLHLVVDMQLDAPDVVVAEVGDFPTGMVTLGEMSDPIDDAAAAATVRYRIQEDRIVRNGELRYYDHPKFGVLARVLRVADDEEDFEEGELLGYPAE
jgi:hypothetical protein